MKRQRLGGDRIRYGTCADCRTRSVELMLVLVGEMGCKHVCERCADELLIARYERTPIVEPEVVSMRRAQTVQGDVA